jgi:hypothetical protein
MDDGKILCNIQRWNKFAVSSRVSLHFLQQNLMKVGILLQTKVSIPCFQTPSLISINGLYFCRHNKLYVKISIFNNKIWICGSECFGLFVMQQICEDLISAKYLLLMMDTSAH